MGNRITGNGIEGGHGGGGISEGWDDVRQDGGRNVRDHNGGGGSPLREIKRGGGTNAPVNGPIV